MVVRVDNNNGGQNIGGQGIGESGKKSALDQLRNTFVSFSVEEEVIRAELYWFLKMVQSDFSFKSADNMVDMLRLLDKESKIFPRMTLGRQKCGYYITHALYPFYLDDENEVDTNSTYTCALCVHTRFRTNHPYK